MTPVDKGVHHFIEVAEHKLKQAVNILDCTSSKH